MGKLDGKVALVTGSGRGIGKAIALRLAREGADIVVDDVIEENINKTVAEVKALGRKAIGIKADVSKKKEVEAMVAKAMETFKKIDILVNNAGIARHNNIIDLAEDDWDSVLEVNLKGVFLCTQAVARHMVSRKYGKIINMASVVSFGAGDIPNYGAAKTGVVYLTKAAARTLGPSGINVNAIAPGMILTDFARNRMSAAELEKFIEGRKQSCVLGRIGSPEDIANVAQFLANDDASFITGTVVSCDGGRTDKL